MKGVDIVHMALIIFMANTWDVGWVEGRNPTNIKRWVSLRSTQPTRWIKL